MGTVRVWHSGDGSVPRDGTWAQAATTLAAGCTAAQDDDTVLVASDHVYSTAASLYYNIPDRVRVVSVDRGTEKYTFGAKETCTGTYTYSRIYRATPHAQDRAGILFEGIDWNVTGTSNSFLILGYETRECPLMVRQCKLTVASVSRIMKGWNGSTSLQELFLDRCTLDASSSTDSSALMFLEAKEGNLTLLDTTLQNLGSRTPFLSTQQDSGRHYIQAHCCDLSAIPVAATQTADKKRMFLDMSRCKLPTNIFSTEVPNYGDHAISRYSSRGTISAMPLGLDEFRTSMGVVQFVTAVYRSGSDGDKNYSLLFDGNSTCGVLNPLVCPLQLSLRHDASASKKLTLFLVSNQSDLKDSDFIARVSWGGEGTDAQGVYVTTEANYGDEAAAGSSAYLKTDTASWTGSGFTTKYKLEIPSIGPTEPCSVMIELALMRASTKVWVCPDLDLTSE